LTREGKTDKEKKKRTATRTSIMDPTNTAGRQTGKSARPDGGREAQKGQPPPTKGGEKQKRKGSMPQKRKKKKTGQKVLGGGKGRVE